MIAKVATILLLIVGALATPAAAPAAGSTRADFCRPHRSLQSFGGELGGRVTGYGAHLVAAPVPVPAGATPAMRLLNVGTEELGYGPRRTQRWVHGSWKGVPQDGFLQPALDYLPAGAVSDCIGPATGRNWAAGKYRWLAEAQSFDNGGTVTTHLLHAVFRLRARR